MASFGQVVRQRRRELGLTQEELGSQVGCATITVRKIESDGIRPSRQVVERLAAALMIPPGEQAGFIQHARMRSPNVVKARDTSGTSHVTYNPASDLVGQQLRGYKLITRLGDGSSGVVYTAEQPSVNRVVAIKLLQPHLADNLEFVRSFESEAQAIARLEHPYIVPLYDYWREPGLAALVMRFMRGGSLRQRLANRPLTPTEACRMIGQIGAALHSAHRIGIVHHDLRPGNVLLDEDGNAYLADFGLAQWVDIHHDSSSGFGQASFYTDVADLGRLLEQMLAGASTTDSSGIEPGSTAQHRAHLPPAISALIKRATGYEATQSYDSVLALVADVEATLSTPTFWTASERKPGSGNTGSAGGLDDKPNPYKGLRAFQEADATDFFGRDTLVQRMLSRLGEPGELARFLAIIGPSGSGKSSIVRAGLVPLLRRGELGHSADWFVTDMLPGTDPWAELAVALERVAVRPVDSIGALLRQDERGLLRAIQVCLPAEENAELFLIIDQFEELFTLTSDEGIQQAFLASLVTALLEPDSRLRLVVTLRADFVDRPLLDIDFGELIRQRNELIPPMTPDELERAIIGPARRAGLALEEGLATTIIQEVGNQPGALPLLQFALTELWSYRSGQLLTHAAYEQIGGVAGALAQRAEALFNQFDVAGQKAVRSVFLRLVTLGEGVEDTRRRVLVSELMPEDSSAQVIGLVLDRFGAARLLTFDRDPKTRTPTVEVAHEALLRAWDRLREWVERARESLRLQRRLAAAAQEWLASGTDASFLARGARLEQFRTLEAQSPETGVTINAAERTFLGASLNEHVRQLAVEQEQQERELLALKQRAEEQEQFARTERATARQLRRRAVALTLTMLVALAGALVAGLFAQRNGSLAEQNAHVAATAAAAASARATAEGIAVQERAVAERQAREARTRALAAQSINNLKTDPERSTLLALQAIAETARVGGQALPEAQTALHQAVAADHLERTLTFAERATNATVSPDGAHLAVVAANSEIWRLYLLDMQSGKIEWQIDRTTDQPARVEDIYARNLLYYPASFSPDGSQIAVTVNMSGTTATALLDSTNGRQIRTIPTDYGRFSPDGSQIIGMRQPPDVTAIDVPWEIGLWDAANGNLISSVALKITRDADDRDPWQLYKLSPDLQRVALVSSRTYIYDTQTGAQLMHLGSAEASVIDVSFRPNGIIAYGDSTGRLTIVDSSSNTPPFSEKVMDSFIAPAEFSPDGERLAFSDLNNTVLVWDVRNAGAYMSLPSHTETVESLVWAPDGRKLITISGGLVRLWDTGHDRELEPFVDLPGSLSTVTHSRDATRFVVYGGNSAAVYDAATMRQLQEITAPKELKSATLSPNNRLLITSESGAVRIWDIETGKQLNVLNRPEGLRLITEVSPDGQSLIEITLRNINVLDIASGKERFTMRGWGAAFSPDGHTIATTNNETSDLTLWNAQTGKQLAVYAGPVSKSPAAHVLFSQDGQQLVTDHFDNSVALWRVGSGVVRTFDDNQTQVANVALSPRGDLVASIAYDGQLYVWNIADGKILLDVKRSQGIPSIGFSPDGRHIYAGNFSGGVTAYILDTNELITLARSRLSRTWTQAECHTYLQNDVCPATP